MKIFLISPTTAGKVTSLAERILGRGLAPWDRLPSSHFVAECGYADLTNKNSSLTTTCPDGTQISLQAAPHVSFYVDQQQQWSTDSLSSSISFAPCTGDGT
jgi:hypothetical protein